MEFISFDLGDDKVQGSLTAKNLDFFTCAIATNLLHCFVPLLLRGFFGRVRLQIFQFHDIGVGGGLATAKVRHQEKVAVAVVEFHLRVGEVIWAETEIRRHKALDIPLPLDEATH